MPGTLTEKLNAIKVAGKEIFVPYITELETTRKGLDGLGVTIPLLEEFECICHEVGIPFRPGCRWT